MVNESTMRVAGTGKLQKPRSGAILSGMAAAVTLKSWREAQKATLRAVAGLISSHLGPERACYASTLQRYETGGRIPDPDYMIAIYRATNGAVRPDSFYNLPDLRAERAAERASRKQQGDSKHGKDSQGRAIG